MKKVFITILLTFTMLVSFECIAYAGTDSFKIDNYIVNVDVLDDGTIEVEEIITVDFNYKSHGIYREIPLAAQYKIKLDDKIITKKLKGEIYDVNVEKHTFAQYKEGNTYFIKIGDYDQYVTGIQEYKITYKLYYGADKIDTFDEFRFNLIGTAWQGQIDHAEFTVNMPKEFNPENVEFYVGVKGSTGNSRVEHTVDGNAIHAHTIAAIYPGIGVTIRILLDEGYFNYRAKKAFNISDISIVYYVLILFILLMFILWLKFGKSPKYILSTDGKLPKDMSSAEVGYIFDGVVDDKDVTSLLISWASKGIITIEEKEKDFILTKKNDHPVFDNEYETLLFKDIFRSRIDNNEKADSVEVSSIKFDIHKTIYKVKNEIIKKYADNRNIGIFTKSSQVIKKIMLFISTAPFLLSVIEFKEDVNGVTVPFIAIYIIASFFIYFGFRNFNTFVSVSHKKQDFLSLYNIVFFAITIILPFFIMGKTFIRFTHDYALSFSMLGTIFISSLLSANMDKPTPKTVEVRQKILGFQTHLKNINDETIQEILSNDQNYFVDILAFTYVLDMPAGWQNKFEKILISMPDWYISDVSDRRFSLSGFNRTFNTMSDKMSAGSFRSGGGGSGGAGGGMGGGGGGSW